jgi:hypothetical protein
VRREIQDDDWYRKQRRIAELDLMRIDGRELVKVPGEAAPEG